jgi:uncharacterized membrane protein YphA (DoxX/SURF4 family)
MKNPKISLVNLAAWSLRISLAIAFLSAVADRLGLWGPPGTANVDWGDLAHFNTYVAQLNWFLPAPVIPMVGWAATIAEVLLGLGLLIGWRLRWVALASALLLFLFAATMVIGLGLKAPLNYSVFTGASAALLLFAVLPRLDGKLNSIEGDSSYERQSETSKSKPASVAHM